MIRSGQKIKFRPIRNCECGDHSFVALTRGMVALVSVCDRWLLEAHSWSAMRSGRTFYAVKTGVGLLHRQIAEVARGTDVDHKNRNGCDNRRQNLRPAWRSMNCANSIGRSGRLKGVKRKGNRWIARIRDEHLGMFDTEAEAHAAYMVRARQVYGEFARGDSR